MKNLFILLFLFVFTTYTNAIHAQCNPEDWVEYVYDWGKTFEKAALEYFPITEAQEEKMGENLHPKMLKEVKVYKTHPKQAYLKKILTKLTKNIKRKGIKYDIHVIKNNKDLNAFSIAGGHVYITEKMLDWVESEDELAFIIAHEVAHIDQKHALAKMQKLEVSHYYFGDEYGEFAGNMSLLLSAPFGQIDEYDADRNGAILATKAGYNPRKGLRFFEKMESGEQYDIVEKVIRTHPYSKERHVCLDHFLTDKLGK